MSACHRVCVRSSRVTRSHTERNVPTRLKKRCPEVGCPFPTGSPFQRLEIPLRTKRPDMIPQHCRRGRELGTVLIRQALLCGKILKGMQPIVVNCMGHAFYPKYCWYVLLVFELERQVYLLMLDLCSCDSFQFCGFRFSKFFLLEWAVLFFWSSHGTTSHVPWLVLLCTFTHISF